MTSQYEDEGAYQLSYIYGLLSNYCGPGGIGIPIHRMDQICRIHDREFTIISKRSGGKNPLYYFNNADRNMIENIKQAAHFHGIGLDETVIKHLSTFLWNIKAKIAPHLVEDEDVHLEIFQTGETWEQALELNPGHQAITFEEEMSTLLTKRGRHTRWDDDGNEYTNSPTPAPTSGLNQMGGKTAGAMEQPLIGPIKFIPFVRPHFFTVRLPLSIVRDLEFPNLFGSALPDVGNTKWETYAFKSMQIVLNSIYDCYNASLFHSPIGFSTVYPNGRDNYVNQLGYTYYRVLETNITITCLPGAPYPEAINRYGQIRVAAALEDGQRTESGVSSITNDCTRWDELPGYKTGTVTNGMNHDNTSCSFSFHYTPDMLRNAVRDKGNASFDEQTVEGWTPCGQKPDLPDTAILIAKPLPTQYNSACLNANLLYQSNNMNGSGTVPARCDMRVKIDVQYTVQFRDSRSRVTTDVNPDYS
jgi:hypothetical protein